LDSPPPPFSLIPSCPIPGIDSTGIIIVFTFLYTQLLDHIHLPIPFPCYLSIFTGINNLHPPPLGQDLFCLFFSDFSEEKKWHFYLFEIKVATQGFSLWYFHVFMYYNPCIGHFQDSVSQTLFSKLASNWDTTDLRL
jgi:hypothetical protein